MISSFLFGEPVSTALSEVESWFFYFFGFRLLPSSLLILGFQITDFLLLESRAGAGCPFQSGYIDFVSFWNLIVALNPEALVSDII